VIRAFEAASGADFSMAYVRALAYAEQPMTTACPRVSHAGSITTVTGDCSAARSTSPDRRSPPISTSTSTACDQPGAGSITIASAQTTIVDLTQTSGDGCYAATVDGNAGTPACLE